jgi:predicted nucleotidyltransferase
MIPDRYKNAINKIKKLAEQDRYLGAFIFGSVVRGEATDQSDLDVKVIIDKDTCENINHPFIDDIKLDITFFSFKQLEARMDHQVVKHERIPMIAESLILFDKTGKLKELKKRYKKAKPKRYKKDEYQLVKFIAHHANEKIEKSLEKDPAMALLGMHLNLNDIIKIHYQIRGRWLVGNKRIFLDLNSWDKPFLKLLKAYILEKDNLKKFKLWSKMIDHILKPIGGRQDVRENNCNCAGCRIDLKNLI